MPTKPAITLALSLSQIPGTDGEDPFFTAARALKHLMDGAYDDPQHPSTLRGKPWGWQLLLTSDSLLLRLSTTKGAHTSLRSARDSFFRAGRVDLIQAFLALPQAETIKDKLPPGGVGAEGTD